MKLNKLLILDMKGEINWAPKGSKPGSPSSGGQPGYGFHWGDHHLHTELTQPVNISPVRTLPPPPDIPDSVSVISHDSNNANQTLSGSGSADHIPTINLAALPPIDGRGENMHTLMEEDENERTPLRRSGNNESPVLPYFEEGTCIDDQITRLWPIPHPDQYLPPHGILGVPLDTLTAIDEEEDCCTCPGPPQMMTPPPVTTTDNNKPLAIRNRYSKKKTGSAPSGTGLIAGTEEEPSESCSLLGAGGSPQQTSFVPGGSTGSRNGTARQGKMDGSPQNIIVGSNAASPASSTGGGTGGSLQKKRSMGKTTHVTQV